MTRIVKLLNPRPCSQCARAAQWEIDGKTLCVFCRRPALGQKVVRYS